MGIKSYHFKEGRTNVQITVIIPVEEYCTIMGDNTWMYNPPVNIDTYNPTSANATSAQRAVEEAEWKRKITALETFNGACEGAKDLIIYGVGEDSVIVNKQQYVIYGSMKQIKMMQHIRDKTCIKMTTIVKAKIFKIGHNMPWDTTLDINIY